MYSTRLIAIHFWLATLGVIFYLVAMGNAGVIQDMMLRAENNDGTLTYRFVESVQAIHYSYLLRAAGGFLYLIGMFLMAYNVWKTKEVHPIHLNVSGYSPLLGKSHHVHGANHSGHHHSYHTSHSPHLPVHANESTHSTHSTEVTHSAESHHSPHH